MQTKDKMIQSQMDVFWGVYLEFGIHLGILINTLSLNLESFFFSDKDLAGTKI